MPSKKSQIWHNRPGDTLKLAFQFCGDLDDIYSNTWFSSSFALFGSSQRTNGTQLRKMRTMSDENEFSSGDEMNEDPKLGAAIADAAEAGDGLAAEQLIRGGDFIILQQIDPETGEVEIDEDQNFSVVLAEVDEDMAVVCFTTSDQAQSFVDGIIEEFTGGKPLPAVALDGNELLDGLPDDCGLLVNPGSVEECYFPPSCFFAEDSESDDESE